MRKNYLLLLALILITTIVVWYLNSRNSVGDKKIDLITSTITPSKSISPTPTRQIDYEIKVNVKDYLSKKGISHAKVVFFYKEPQLGIPCTKDFCPPRPNSVKVFEGETNQFGSVSFRYKEKSFFQYTYSHPDYLKYNLDTHLIEYWFNEKKPFVPQEIVKENNAVTYTLWLIPKTAIKITTVEQALSIAKNTTALSSWLISHPGAKLTTENNTDIGVWWIRYQDGEKFYTVKIDAIDGVSIPFGSPASN